jgi:ABC-type transporter Mla MlaB component
MLVMLRITEVADDSGILLRIEGKLREPWVGELDRAARRRLAEGRGLIRLDLSSLTFADEAGVCLLHELLRQGAQVASASGFIRVLLRLEDQ